MLKISRNGPCPCGSGKKYKKCCIDDENLFVRKSEDIEKSEDDYLPPKPGFNFGKANLSASFFQKHHIGEFSSFSLLQFTLLQGFFNVINDFSKKNNIIERCKEQKELIKNTNDLYELFEILHKEPDPFLNGMLVEKILLQKEKAITLIINSLKNGVMDPSLELYAQIIHRSKIDCSDDLVDLIKNGDRRVYLIAVLCFLLGNYNNKKSIQILWDHFHYFKINYPNKSYADGPFLALKEIYFNK